MNEGGRAANPGDCVHCLGQRRDCTCTGDCGARPGGLGAGYRAYCPRAAGYLDYLRATGLYGEDELTRMAERGHR
ncbi:MAG TPA: hypothetical protein VHT94_07285 [Streptosporangiaceae bacterium]|nr:hypothetical protein [Streptosporangiaceae bacterium]